MPASCRAGPAEGGLAGRRAVVVNWRDTDHTQAGGAERYAWELARALAGAGLDVEFLTARDHGQVHHTTREGIRIVRVGGRLTFLPRAFLRLARLRRRLDVVVDCACGLPAFSPLVLSPRRTAIVLVVHHVHQTQFTAMPQPLAGLARALERRAMPRAYRNATTVAVSESTRLEMTTRLSWRAPILVVPNGTDEAPPATSAPDDERVIVLGRLSHHKRVDLAVRALVAAHQRRPGLRVDIVGDGPEHGRLRRLIDTLDAAAVVRMHGRVSEEDKHLLLSRATVHLCASEAEGWGQVVLEAAGHGVPTVARRVPGLRESVRAGTTGWLIAADPDEATTVAALTDAVDEALDELSGAQRRAELADACRAWAAQFTWTSTHDAVLAVTAAAVTQVWQRATPRD